MSRIDYGIEIYTIWTALEWESDAPWMLDAWDEYSIDGNASGWDEALEKAKDEAGGQPVRVLKFIVDYEQVQKAFQVGTINSTGKAEEV